MSQRQHQAPSATVAQHLGALRRLMQQIPRQHVQAVNEFWADIRQGFRVLEMEAHHLRARVVELTGHAIERPATTSTALATRDAYDQELHRTAAELLDISMTVNILGSLPAAWAMDQIVSMRNDNMTNNLGCWMTTQGQHSAKGYIKRNLRNTANPNNPRRKLNIQPFAHQLAVVAGGEGALLGATAEQAFEVSHLCHNTGCFNPAHVVVESQEVNRSRNQCKGLANIKLENGTVFEMCPHSRSSDNRRRCLLPIYEHVGGGPKWMVRAGATFVNEPRR